MLAMTMVQKQSRKTPLHTFIRRNAWQNHKSFETVICGKVQVTKPRTTVTNTNYIHEEINSILDSVNGVVKLDQNFLFPCPLSKSEDSNTNSKQNYRPTHNIYVTVKVWKPLFHEIPSYFIN
jgi:hypothetical protein